MRVGLLAKLAIPLGNVIKPFILHDGWRQRNPRCMSNRPTMSTLQIRPKSKGTCAAKCTNHVYARPGSTT